MTCAGRPVPIGALRCGRLLETAMGLVDLATGRRAHLTSRPLDRVLASEWTAPAPGLVSEDRRHVVLDAWLTQDWLGRWTERVVAIPAADAPLTGRGSGVAMDGSPARRHRSDTHGWPWRVVPSRRVSTRGRHRAGTRALARRARRSSGCAVAAAADRGHGHVVRRGCRECGCVGQARWPGVDAGSDHCAAGGVDHRYAAAIASGPVGVALRRTRTHHSRETTASRPACARPRAALSLVHHHPVACWRS